VRLILDLVKAQGPIARGKRGGKIYGYDAKGKPIYSKPEHRGQAGYAERRETKLERTAERARRMLAESKSREKSARQIMDIIPPGQPILVGHHSEKRHRRDLERMDRNMRAAIAAEKEAKRLEAAAKNPSSAISSDDPEAVVKLKQKLGSLEKQREEMKAINKAFRKHKGDLSRVQVELELSDSMVAAIKRSMAAVHWEKMPFPGYSLTNLGARIRDVKKRIEGLAQEAARPEAAPIEGAGWRIHEDYEDNRIHITFQQKPPRETIRELKSNGFKWSPSRGAWVRQLNNNGRYAAQDMAKNLATTSLPGAVSATTDKPVETERETQQRREAPHTKRVNIAQQAYALKMVEARQAMDASTDPDWTVEERSKLWTQAAMHIQDAIDLVRDRNAAQNELRALRPEKASEAQLKKEAREVQELEDDAAKARAKAANPDGDLPLPFFGGRTEERIRVQMLKEIEEAKAKERAKQATKAKKPPGRGYTGGPGRPYQFRGLTGPRAEPAKVSPKPKRGPIEKKSAEKGKMAAREKAGQKLLLSYAAQLHLDN
jgi:hypothetical protein